MDDEASSILPAPHARHLAISVVKVRAGSHLQVGHVFETHRAAVLIGRDPGAEVRLNDRTVSRQHARLHDDGEQLWLENLSAKGATMLNRARLSRGERVSFAPGEAHIQVGGVLLRVRSSAETTAFQSALSIDGFDGLPRVCDPRPSPASTPEPFLGLTWDAGHCHVRLYGRLLAPYPATAAVLAALCETPGEPVHRFDLEEALGEGGSLEQQVSLVRRMFADEVDAGSLPLDTLRAFVSAHSTGPHVAKMGAMDTREVLRHFVASRRGYGYVICLGADDIARDAGRG